MSDDQPRTCWHTWRTPEPQWGFSVHPMHALPAARKMAVIPKPFKICTQILKEKLFTIDYDVRCELFIYALFYVEVSFYSYFVECFHQETC